MTFTTPLFSKQFVKLLPLVLLTQLAFASAVQAQGSVAPAAPAGTTTTTNASPGKKELAGRIVRAQQSGIEGMARKLTEQPAAVIMERAGAALSQRVAADKQMAVGKEIQADVKKYLDEAVPLVQARALKLAPTTIGTLLEEKFTEDELKQVLAIIESPVYSRFQALSEDMQNVLLDKLVAETRATIEPKVKVLEQSVGKRLGMTETAPAAAKPPAKPASASK
jgi:uncharacterized protein